MQSHPVLARHGHADDVAFTDPLGKVVGGEECDDAGNDECCGALFHISILDHFS